VVSLECAVTSPSGVWGGAPAEIEFGAGVLWLRKSRDLVATILLRFFLRISWPNWHI